MIKHLDEMTEFELVLYFANRSALQMDRLFWTVKQLIDRRSEIPTDTDAFFDTAIFSMFNSLFLIILSLCDYFDKDNNRMIDDVNIDRLLKYAINNNFIPLPVQDESKPKLSYQQVQIDYLEFKHKYQNYFCRMKLYRNKKIGHVTTFSELIPSFQYDVVCNEVKRFIDLIFSYYTNCNKEGISMKAFTGVNQLLNHMNK